MPKPQLPEIKPHTLTELLALSADELERCDVARMNLLCAEGLRGAEDMNVESLLDTLAAWTKHVESETQKNFHRFVSNPRQYNHSLAYYRMLMLATILQQDFGTLYSPQRAAAQLKGVREPSDTFFGNSRDVLLNGLLNGDRVGTCASLPVLYTAVAQRLGYPVALASAPEHMYVRYEGGGEHLNVEATSIGFNTYPDAHYRHWPHLVTDEEARMYGFLRPRTQQELLGDFLTTRAHVLTSMKRFNEAAETWAAAAKYLPETPALKSIVQHSRERATNEHNANRWDALAEELTALPVFFDDKFADFQDRKVRIQRFMNQSSDLAAIEKLVKELKDDIEAHRKEAMLASDAPSTANPPPPRIVAASPELAELLANPPLPQRVEIPAERIPVEYWNEFPPELQKRLRGLKKPEEIVSEINSFQIEEVNRRNQEAMAAQLAAIPRQPRPLPRYVRPEYLPAEWREEMPDGLRKRLERVSRPEYVVGEIRQYQLDEQNKRWSEEAERLMQQDFEPGVPPAQSGPPVQIQIIHQRTTTP